MSDDDASPLVDLFAEDVCEQSWEPSGFLTPHGRPIELQPAAAQVWGSASNLALWLSSKKELIAGKAVVELGCSAGLPSLVAASLGASRVIGTDADRNGVAALARAISHNGFSEIATSAVLDWRVAEHRASICPVPVILAADCNYTTAAVPPLLLTIDALLAPGGRCYLASREARHGLEECLERMQAEGEGGLALRLEQIVTFDANGQATDSDSASLSNHEDSAPHRLWIFARADAGSSATALLQEQGLYHERQALMRCGRHALNNLLGGPSFATTDLDYIASSISAGALDLSHRWPILGNYDVNCIIIALQQRGLEAEWWDRRKSDDELRVALVRDGAPSLVGLLLNVRSRPRFLGGWMPVGRHWLALRPLQSPSSLHPERQHPAPPSSPPLQPLQWADVDSHLEAPVVFSEDVLIHKVGDAIRAEDGHLIVVRRSSAAQAT